MRSRVVASAAVAAVLALATAGCGFITPQGTEMVRDLADGVNTKIGDVAIENALVISDNGQTGNLVFRGINESDEAVTLSISYSSGGTRTTIQEDLDPLGAETFGADGNPQVLLTRIDTKPGALLPVYFQYGDAEGRELMVPVLTTGQAEYSTLAPTPRRTLSSPTPAPSDLPLPAPSATP